MRVQMDSLGGKGLKKCPSAVWHLYFLQTYQNIYYAAHFLFIELWTDLLH